MLNRSWCYNNEPDSCTKYGRLYTWAAAIDSETFSTDAENVQGICPPGWHLPTNTEWNTLFSVGSSSTAGKILKSQMGWKEGINGADGVGFSALPAGSRSPGGFFDYVGGFAYFWGSVEKSNDLVYYMYLFHFSGDASMVEGEKDNAFSIRCLKD